MNNRRSIAVSKLLEGYNCAQAVFYSFCDDLGFDKDTALKIACGFGAGMGRKGEVCGAVSGGILVIGARFGRGEKDDRAQKENTYARVRELMDRFSERHYTVLCRRLIRGCDLATEEGQRQFKEEDLLNKICRHCVQTTVEIVEDILAAAQ